MAIHFEWYENPVPPNQPDEKKLHARITYNGKIGTDYVRRKIQERCSLTETDVTAVLDALSHVLGQELGDGRQVHLDGIGYFHPTLKCIEEVTAETKRKNTNDPCGLPADLRIYEVESDGAYPQAEGGRENSEYRNTYATGICARSGVLRGEQG